MEENRADENAPTERQLNTIRSLARVTKSSVNLNTIKTKQEASKLIEDLVAKQNGNNANGNGSIDCREKKVVYGLAVKLIFTRYQQQIAEYRTEEFWKEVEGFYQQYLQHQDRAMKLGSQR